MEDKRVLLVCQNLYPDGIGGIEVFNYRLIKWLAGNPGLRPVVLTRGSGGGLDGIEILRAPERWCGSPFFAWAKATFLAFWKNRRSSVIHLSFSRSHWREWLLYTVAAWICRVPYIIYIHGGGMHPWRPVWPYRLAFRRAQQLFCVSDVQKDEYQKRAARSLTVLPPLVPPAESALTRLEARRHLKMPSDGIIVVAVGTLKPIKGTDILLAACNELAPEMLQRRNVHLYFIGSGDSAPYQGVVKKSEIKERIHFSGPVPNEEIGSVYKAADIYVLPSRLEGMPMALLDASFSGVASIVSDLPCLQGLRQDERDCLKFPIEDSHALGKQLTRLIEDDALRAGLGDAGAEFYRSHYDGEGAFRVLADSFKRLASC